MSEEPIESVTPLSAPPLNVAFITAGAAGMFCGSCLRDNAAAAAMIQHGHQVTLLSLYTPIRTDETNVSQQQVFFGGLNTYLRERWPWFHKLPRFLTSWLDSPWLINRLASGALKTSAQDLGKLTVSMLHADSGPQAGEVDRLVDYLQNDLRPEIVDFSNLLIAGCLPQIKHRLKVPVCVTLQGDDLFIRDLVEPYRNQALQALRNLAKQVDQFITFSGFYADKMSELLQVPRARFSLVPLGIHPGDLVELTRTADLSPAANEFRIGYFARHCEAKGFHHLIEAFIQLKRLPGMEHVKLRSAGWLSAGDQDFYRAQLARLAVVGLQDQYEYLGVLDRGQKFQFLKNLDLFTVPTVYEEPKGLFLLEAMATGLACVQPAHGSFPELLRQGDCGVLVPPHNPAALVDAWKGLIESPAQRKLLAMNASKEATQMRTTARMAQEVAEVYRAQLSTTRSPSMATSS